MFRTFLSKLREQYVRNKNKLYLYSSITMIFLVVCSFFVDHFLPFILGYNFLRAFMLIPLAISIFVFGYTVGLELHNKRYENNPDWVPYRLRMSLKWRRRVAIIILSFLVVIAYGTIQRIGYTLVSSLIVSVGIALYAFIRPTKKESELEDLNIPDIRDLRYQETIKQLQKERAEKKNKKKEK